ncbi:cadherin domain-containing protein [Pirellulaceae bacterium SH449]
MSTSFKHSRSKQSPKRSYQSVGRSRELRRSFRRRLFVETLESRRLLAADIVPSEPVSIPRAPLDLMLANQEYFRQFDGMSRAEASQAGITNLDNTFRLHSRPNATKTIYLDFHGFVATGTAWNAFRGRDPIISPPYDPANNGPEFSNGELLEIQAIWQLVSTDFSPFDINVTTEDPGEAALVNTGGGDDRWGIRVVFTPDDFPLPGSGGVAFIDSFNWGYESPGASDTPTYVFNIGAIFAAAAASHEVGHTMGLSHDGTNAQHPTQPNVEYYTGHGTGEFSWGPIMGVGGYYRNVTTWDNGVYFGANNGGANANYGAGPDDLQVITTRNGFGYRLDDHGGTIDTATTLSGPVNEAARVEISEYGVIERSDDLDFFQFQTGDGPINLTINPYVTEMFVNGPNGFVRTIEDSFRNATNWSQNQGTNLNVEARLYDSQGALVAIADKVGLAAQFINLDLVAGTYYLSVDGVGFGDPTANPPLGFTDYGSLGEYMITGDITVALGLQVSRNPVIYVEDNPAVPIVTSARLVDATPGGYQGAVVSASVVPFSGHTDELRFLPPSGSAIRREGTSILFQNLVVGTLIHLTPTDLEVRFNAAATPAAIEATIPAIAFIATGDAPDPRPRSISLSIQKGIFSSTTVLPLTVIPVNDAPIAFPVWLDPIDEDNVDSPGTLVRDVLARGVIDPDGEQPVGIVISQNPNSPDGTWQYRAGADWRNLGQVSINNGLVLGVGARLRFVPSQDFFGDAPLLSYYAIDPTYSGSFTTNTARVTAEIPALIAATTSSVAPSFINKVIRPVNDAPVGNYPSLSVSVLQDDTFTLVLPEDLFFDVDDTEIALSIRNPGGTASPSWIQVDSANGIITGTPRNNNVGVTVVNIVGTDPHGLFGIVPLIITVINVNDRPERVTLTPSEVPENSRNFRIGSFTTFDPDPGDRHTYTVDDPRFFVIDNILFTSPNANIDFEVERSITVNVMVTDSGTPPLSLVQPVVITVLNVNEFPPRFVESPVFTVSESLEPGSPVGFLVAVDDDADTVVTYQVLRASPFFDVNPATGLISLKQGRTLDWTAQSVHEFVVVASDGQLGSAAQTVRVNVVPRNRFAPVFTTTTLEVSEVTQPGVPFARIIATDPDPMSSVNYEVIDSDLPPFDLNPQTGDLTLRPGASFDAFVRNQYSISARATDNGIPALSAEIVIPITILPVRRPPTSIGTNPATVQSSISGAVVGQIQVVHTNANISYRAESIDSRFEVVDNILRMRPGRAIAESEPATVLVPMRVREVLADGSTGRTFSMNLSLGRVANPSPWQNRLNQFDINGDTNVNPLDVLVLVNAINDGFSLTIPRPASTLSMPFFDVDGDNSLTPIDVLLLVNLLNTQAAGGQAEGESRDFGPALDSSLDLALSSVLHDLENERDERRRRMI